MKLRPLADKVIVKPLSKEETTASGIVLPDTVDKDKPEEGEVIAIGPGRLLDNGSRAAMSIKVGDKVLFTKYSPNEFKKDNQEYLVLSESDIMAVVEA